MEPTVLDMFALAVRCLTEPLPPIVDAVMAHGAPVLDEELDKRLLNKLADLHNRGKIRIIALNGLSGTRCKELHIAYQGWERSVGVLTNAGVPLEDILILPESTNTAVECNNFFAWAKRRKIINLALSTHPHHQIRCFLTGVGVLDANRKKGYQPSLFNVPGPGFAGDRPLFKPVLHGSGLEDVPGYLHEHLQAEFARIIKYAKPAPIVNGKPEYIPHATIARALAYLQERDSKR